MGGKHISALEAASLLEMIWEGHSERVIIANFGVSRTTLFKLKTGRHPVVRRPHNDKGMKQFYCPLCHRVAGYWPCLFCRTKKRFKLPPLETVA